MIPANNMINLLVPKTSAEMEAFKARKPALLTRSKTPDKTASTGASGSASARQLDLGQLPECCTYDQVYKRIIELLNKTASSADSPTGDYALSRAYLDELEVSWRTSQMRDDTTAKLTILCPPEAKACARVAPRERPSRELERAGEGYRVAAQA